MNPSKTIDFPSLLLAVIIGSLALGISSQSVEAGNGPQNYLLVYDPTNPLNISIANHYKIKRGIPESNVMAYSFPRDADGVAIRRVISAAECYAFIQAIRDFASANQITHLNGILLAGETPLNVQKNSASNPTELQGSIIAALWNAPNLTSDSDLEAAICLSDSATGYENYAFSTNSTEEVRSNKSYNGNKYWLATHLGYIGARGLRLPEVISLIDRSVSADGTKEQGTIYWPMNGDVRSGVREGQVSSTTAEWNTLGLAHHVFGKGRSGTIYGGDSGSRTIARNKNLPPGSSDIQNRAVQGMVCGFAMPQDLENAGNIYTKGAIAEHVTSNGGVMGEGLFVAFSDVGPQMAHSEWLRWGAAGSSGTVKEPWSIASKFPHSKIHSHYFRGATLAEAFLLSVKNPRQLMVSGDPLCQPYATPPVVTLSGLSNNATISGNVTIGVSVSGAAEAPRDLFVNGRYMASSNGNFTLNTTQLAEGFNEIRVVAYGNNSVRTQGSAVRIVRVRNTNANVSLSSNSTSVNYRGSLNVSASVSGLSGVSRVEIVSNGATLATLGASGGTAAIKGEWLSSVGQTRVFAVAVLTNGSEVWSMPLNLQVNWPNLASQSVNVGTALAQANLWPDATGSNFSWTNPSQSTLVEDRDFLIFQNTDTGGGNITIDFPMVTSSMLNKAAMEFVTYFEAKEAGLYDFAVARNCGITLMVGGRTLIDYPTPTNNPGPVGDISAIAYRSEMLAAGRHEVRIRVKQIKSKTGFRIGVRSSYGRLAPVKNTRNAVLDFVQLGNGGNCGFPANGNPPPSGSFTESFSNLNQSSPGNGTFMGDSGFAWTYTESLHQDSGINGRSFRFAYGTGATLQTPQRPAGTTLSFKIRNAVSVGSASEYGVNVYVNGQLLPGSPFRISTMGQTRSFTVSLPTNLSQMQLRFQNQQRALLLDDIVVE